MRARRAAHVTVSQPESPRHASLQPPQPPHRRRSASGYVGLPLAVEFGKHFETVGFDIKAARIAELRRGKDSTLEVDAAELAAAKHLTFTRSRGPEGAAGVFIVTVPTPIDEYKRPDLTPLRGASETVGQVLKKGDIVIYESTVYPGCTEEVCVPILEQVSGLKFNHDFFAGYSPERINPGDKQHRLPTILKVTSGSTPEVADFVDALYGSDHHGRHAQGVQHPGGRGGQGHREHAARRQHRADQRAGADLQPARHRHRGSAEGGRHASGISCRSGPAWSAATASASIRTT